MITLVATLKVITWMLVIAVCAFLVCSRLTHRSRMAALARWTARQRALGEELARREIREENLRSHSLQITTGWHRPDALEIARLEHTLHTWSDEQLAGLAAVVRSSVAQRPIHRERAEVLE